MPNKPAKDAHADDYQGLLAEPMRVPQLLDTPEEKGNWVLDQVSKTILLFQHFDIDPNGECAWRDLAMTLARKHVPGFGPPPKPQGRPMERGDDAITLVMLVELLKLRGGRSARGAIKEIASAGAIDGAEATLRDMYNKAVSRRSRPNKQLLPLVDLLDRVRQAIGDDEMIECLEDAVGRRSRQKK
jgi:hypothetical protein